MSTTEPSKDDVAKSPDVEKAKDNANSVDGQGLKFTPEEEEVSGLIFYPITLFYFGTQPHLLTLACRL